MSWNIVRCGKCHCDCEYQLSPRLDVNSEGVYAVAWRCPRCDYSELDVCPIGPLVPKAGLCLNCGSKQEVAAAPCTACGIGSEKLQGLLDQRGNRADPVQSAQAAFRQGRVRLAELILNDALLHKVDLEATWKLKIGWLSTLGYSEAKVKMLQEALRDEESPSFLVISYGCALQECGRDREAVDVYRRFLERYPGSGDAGIALSNQANSLSNLGELEAASDLYRQAIAIEPTRATHYYNYARCLRRRRQLDEALDTINRSLSLQAQSGSRETALALQEKAYILAELEQGQQALDCIDKVFSLGLDSWYSHYIKGWALGLVGRLPEARDEMELALKLDPQNPDAIRGLTMIENVIGKRPNAKGSWWKRLFRG